MLTGRAPPEETFPTSFRPAGVRSITEMEPSPSLATKSHRRSSLSASAPWEPTDTTPPPKPPVGTVAASESAPSAALLNTKTALFGWLVSVYTNPVSPLDGRESFDCAILAEVVPAMAIASMTVCFQSIATSLRLCQLNAGTDLDVKCLFAIDSIAAVYRADPARRGK